MAAHGYYDTGYGNHPPTYDQAFPHPDPVNSRSPAPSYSGNPYAAPADPYDLRHSQQSIGSDQGPYVAGGRLNEHDQYAENIPLKSQNQYANGPPPGDWMQQPTHYPPPEMIEPPVAARPGRKKKGFFKKKIPWVTYTLTLVMIVVFIVELVKSGMLNQWDRDHFRPGR